MRRIWQDFVDAKRQVVLVKARNKQIAIVTKQDNQCRYQTIEGAH